MNTNTKQRKTIRLQIEGESGLDPRVFKVVREDDREILVESSALMNTMLLEKASGALVNRFGTRFVEVKADRRPKPFAIHYVAMDGRMTRKFATLADAAKYVWDRYQGVEYFDGAAAFHTDYAAYTLEGFTLADVYTIDRENWHAERKVLA